MTIKVNIKMKDPKFKGDHPSFNVSVSGPTEIFSAKLKRTLELNGLSPYIENDGMTIWTAPYNIGGPSYYLTHLLAHKFDAEIHKNCRENAHSVVKRRSLNDGLEHILGAHGVVPAGLMELKVVASATDFAANCDADDEERQQFLRSAGWVRIKNTNERIVARLGSAPYRTRDPFIAGNLEPFMSPDAKRLLSKKIADARHAISESKTQSAEGSLDIPCPEGLGFLPFQQKGISIAMRSPKGAIIADDMGLGKAQPHSARILTMSGWTTMGAIQKGDMVIGSNGKPINVLEVYPQGVKDIFCITFSDGSRTRSCREHYWTVFDADGERRTVQLSDIMTEMKAPGHRGFFIPMVAPVRFSEKVLSRDPYEIGKSWASAKVSAIQKDYLFGSVDQRTSLLQGYLDAADNLMIDKTLILSCREPDENLIELIQSLGGKSTIRPGRHLAPFVAPDVEAEPATGRHQILEISLPAEIKPFRNPERLEAWMDYRDPETSLPLRRIALISPVEPEDASCISVEADDNLYVTDDYILTHNTMQGIGIVNATEGVGKVLVVCQANMRLKWAMEIEKWKTHPNLTVGVAEGSKFPDTDVCVINYDILQKNIDALRAQEWDIIICDEAHNMKNPEAQRTKAVLGDLLEDGGDRPLKLGKDGKIVHLTGTPKPNRIEELWPLISSTRPDIWGSGPEDFEIFKNRYCPPILIKKKMGPPGRQRDVIIPMNGRPIREMELQLRLRGSGSFVRRMKRDNPDLPPKFRTPLEMPVRLSKYEKELLRDAEADLDMLMERVAASAIRRGETTEAGAIISAISVIDPDTPNFSEMARVRRNLGMIKAPHCAKFIIDEIEAEKDFSPENRTKTVVFAHHKDVIKIIHEEAERRMKGAFLVYDGSITSAKKKQEIVDRFQGDDAIRGIIISLSGNTGITLTESARMRVVEPDWSPSNMVQIEDRIWRIGQMKNVDIGYLSIAGTLDARIGGAIASKMETDERSINSITFKHKNTSQKAYLSANPKEHSTADGESARVTNVSNDAGEEAVAVESTGLPLFG
ncbi:SNF2-related protein [Pseudosulfitobacter pseudonitzschiae]|uniref:DEAD/DEAH box helicase n=1 Tax=Pseudosulfitobacter pseudonitzschiae TaxID=1402135 RepID=UPI003B80B9CD